MTNLRHAVITGTGKYIPTQKVLNTDLEKLMDTSDEWIRKRSGISSRYYADESCCTSDLALEAARQALTSAHLEPSDIDLIIAATLSPDHYFPGIGVKLQHKLGLTTTPAMDIRNQCSGFIYSLNVAQALIGIGQYRRILVVGAELHSKLINFSTQGRDVAVLFGDGAGAIVLEASDDSDRGVKACQLYSQGEFADRLWINRPGTSGRRFIEMDDIEHGRHLPTMDGRYVFKHATKRLEEAVTSIIASQGLSIESVDHFLFHQANIRINEHVAESLGIPLSKVHNNIEKYGNCSAGSLPILLDECVREGRIKRGDLICLAAFGAGFTWASSLVRW